MRIAAGIITCNEEQTIGPLLDAIRQARGDHFEIVQIVVVSAACRDRTDEIVRSAAAADCRIELITEPERRGKSAAVNTFLAARKPSDLTFLLSGDILPAPDATGRLAAAFQDAPVGMAGGRPSPVNSLSSLTGRMAHIMWELHHRIALQNPKLGEAVMFRSRLVSEIPGESPVDEASIEAEVIEKGFTLRYVPQAVIANRGPDTLSEWLSQRRRIAYGHAWLHNHSRHAVSTGKQGAIASHAAGMVISHPGHLPDITMLATMEITARLLARRDARRGVNRHTIWQIAGSTKIRTGS